MQDFNVDLIRKKGLVPEHVDIILNDKFIESTYPKIQMIRRWEELTTSTGLALVGSAATGKSVLGQLAVIDWLRKGKPARRLVWDVLNEEISRGYMKVPKVYTFDKLIFFDDINNGYAKTAEIAMNFIKMSVENGVKVLISLNKEDYIPHYNSIQTMFAPVDLGSENLRELQQMKDLNYIYGKDIC